MLAEEKPRMDFVGTATGSERSIFLVLDVERRVSRSKYLAHDVTGRCVVDMKGVPRDTLRRLKKAPRGTCGKEAARGLVGKKLLVAAVLKKECDRSQNGSFTMRTLLRIFYAHNAEEANYKELLYTFL